MSKLKTIKLKGNEYVQVNTRVEHFNKEHKNGRIKTEVNFSNNTVWFKAVVTPDIEKKDRFFVGHSFGQLGKEKAFEKLETVAVGRALAFMGIGIVESIASSDEMANFSNNQKYTDNNGVVKEVTGECDICGSKAIPAKTKQGRVFATCPNWKKHKEAGEKAKIIQKPKLNEKEQKFMDELDATETTPEFDNLKIKN